MYMLEDSVPHVISQVSKKQEEEYLGRNFLEIFKNKFRVMVIYIDLLSHVDLDFFELNIGEFHGLQRRILDEDPYAFYIHCFAHQLQLLMFLLGILDGDHIIKPYRMYLEEDLVELAQIYVDDFTEYDCIIQVSYHTDRHVVFPLVYRLIELALILPIATATIERAF
ncbi:hypothetical protein ACJX0J_010797 [Zea mays]